MDNNNIDLPKLVEKRKRRLGQGLGSGRGKTSGRGTKGQKARGNIKLSFEGGALPLIKRLPALSGKDRNKVFKPKPYVVNVDDLQKLSKGSLVDVPALIKNRIVSPDATLAGVKVLGDGELSVSLTVKLPVSKQAREKIEKAGGRVEV